MTSRSLILVLCVAAALAAREVAAQDVLDTARTLYASARYEEALVALDQLRFSASAPSADALVAEKYRALCLLALGREEEAETAFAGVVAVDPAYLPDTREVSPSVLAFFRNVRQRMLPSMARARYAEAKAAYDRGAYASAAEGFESLAAFLADWDTELGLPGLSELASGFAELSRERAGVDRQVADARRGAAGPPPLVPAEPAPPAEVYGPDTPGITPPVALRQDTPPPPSEARLMGRARALLEIVVDERGLVASAVVVESAHAAYDRQLIDATASWTYEPATLDGRAVKFRKLVEVAVR